MCVFVSVLCDFDLSSLLMYNAIDEVPESIGNVSTLVSLDIPDNYLQDFPDSVSSLVNLKSLFVILPFVIPVVTFISFFNLCLCHSGHSQGTV